MISAEDTPLTAPDGRFSTGDRINGRYTIQKLLGEGGFAAVYLARQDGLDQDVALKVLEVADDNDEHDQVVKRFMREASVSSQLRHPNIVGIFECGLLEGDLRPFIAMEFLDGHDLEAELKRKGPMAFDRARKLMAGSLDALSLAHKEGIVHKDLKPSNLFIDHPEELCEALRVVDFGVARLVRDEEGKMTSTGQIFGTPHYLSPEYIERLEATPALDVYQMGLILVEMLTGRTVVQGDNMFQCMMTHCLGEVRVPLMLVDSPLGPVLERALNPNPDERYPEAGAFLKALMRVDASAVPGPPVAGQLVRVTDIQAWHDDPKSVDLTDGPLPIELGTPEPDVAPIAEAVTRQISTKPLASPDRAATASLPAISAAKSRANTSLELITFSALILVALIIAALPALIYSSSNPGRDIEPAVAVTAPATTAAGDRAAPKASPAKATAAPVKPSNTASGPDAATVKTAASPKPNPAPAVSPDADTEAAPSAAPEATPKAPSATRVDNPSKRAPSQPASAPDAKQTTPEDAEEAPARPVKRRRPAKPAKPSITFIDDNTNAPASKKQLDIID